HYLAGTGFRITPVLAVVQPGFQLTINPDEVADVFEVPLSFLMNPDNHRRDSKVFNGTTRHFYVMPYGERQIWGITAGILRTLYERLYA
ncbi:NUDIX hydrolase, partial [Agrobacterium vitis]